MIDNRASLSEAVALIDDDSVLALGGSLLQRVPAAFSRELVRQGKRGLHLVKPSPGYDGDLLAAAGVLAQVSAGMVSLEQPHGIARGFRRAVERGEVRVNEHACITVASAMRAASLGIPFQPLPGLTGSDVRDTPGFLRLTDPETGEDVMAIRAIQPDWAVLHVHVADTAGNARITGTPNWDPLMATAARQVIITAERVVSQDTLRGQPELTTINDLNVAAVVEAPRGAWPGACWPAYDIDHEAVRAYMQAVRTPAGLAQMLAETEAVDHGSQVPQKQVSV